MLFHTMEKSFQLSIVSPDQILYDDQILSVTLPGEMGYCGILANHAPMIGLLVSGQIAVRDKADKRIFFTSKGKGFWEVLNNKVSVVINEAQKLDSWKI